MTAAPLASRRDLLTLVLDVLVPSSNGFPGAGAVALEHVLAAAVASAPLASLLSEGLRAVEQAAGTAGFAALDPAAREGLLRVVESERAEFFEALVRHTYDGYYSHPAIVARLGLDPGPIHPRGHRVEQGDLAALARVVARGPLYRAVDGRGNT